MATRIDLAVLATLLIGTVSCDNAIFEGKSGKSKANQSDKSDEPATDDESDDEADDADDEGSEGDPKKVENDESDVDSLPPAESLGKFYFKVASTKSDSRYFLSGLSILKYEGDTDGKHDQLEICVWNDDATNWDIYTWSGVDVETISNKIIKSFGYKAASYLLLSGNDPDGKVLCEPTEDVLGWENTQNPSPASPLLSSTWLDFDGYVTTKGQAQRSVANRYVAPLAEPCPLLENKPEEVVARIQNVLAKKVPSASKKTGQTVCDLNGI